MPATCDSGIFRGIQPAFARLPCHMKILIRLLPAIIACVASGAHAADATEKTFELAIVRGAVAAEQRVLRVEKDDAVRVARNERRTRRTASARLPSRGQGHARLAGRTRVQSLRHGPLPVRMARRRRYCKTRRASCVRRWRRSKCAPNDPRALRSRARVKRARRGVGARVRRPLRPARATVLFRHRRVRRGGVCLSSSPHCS